MERTILMPMKMDLFPVDIKRFERSAFPKIMLCYRKEIVLIQKKNSESRREASPFDVDPVSEVWYDGVIKTMVFLIMTKMEMK